ncbi:hypothetical protein M5K25_015092 [Dendrobium thyrsiflorum]|uniref:Uncharacterized protein n=1 Tax=Dendrobium thyrsiflorum TaxID=117978 RepID=A0ABD0UPC0_DENTH
MNKGCTRIIKPSNRFFSTFYIGISHEAAGVNFIGSDDVVAGTMIVSDVEVAVVDGVDKVSCPEVVCVNSSEVVPSPDPIDGPVRGEPSVSPVTVGSLGTETLVEAPIVVMSPNGLNARCALIWVLLVLGIRVGMMCLRIAWLALSFLGFVARSLGLLLVDVACWDVVGDTWSLAGLLL